jgi:hypothetical protein
MFILCSFTCERVKHADDEVLLVGLDVVQTRR